ncbi:hypothetical protein Tco_0060630 [Tanacetum coccineum]
MWSTNNGKHVDTGKIVAVKKLGTPHRRQEFRVEIVLGLAGYYRRFIANFSKIAKPLTLLTQKNKKYVWGAEQEEAFKLLKSKERDETHTSTGDGNYYFILRERDGLPLIGGDSSRE